MRTFGIVWIRLIAVIGILAFPCASLAGEWGPWSESAGAPVIGNQRAFHEPAEPFPGNPVARFLVKSVRFFQKYISPVDGDRCSMVPTCSHYSLEAIRKHGALLGFVMSADRIVHEYDEQRYVPVIWDGKAHRFYDPVENNDFWFARPQRTGE